MVLRRRPEVSFLLQYLFFILRWSSHYTDASCFQRTDQHSPWHPDSRFNRLRSMLADFQNGLPRNLQYSPRNTDTHIYRNTLAPYTTMHAIYFLSIIVLHRAYLPFLPLRCSEPGGPLDEPLFPPDRMNPPDNFWQENARELFRTARQVIDLTVACQERGALVENALVGFAIYNAAFIGVYASHFPHMDQDGFLSSKPAASGEGSPGPPQILRKAVDIIRNMRPRLKLATGWFRTLNRLHTYFCKVRRDATRPARKFEIKPDPVDQYANGSRSDREGGAGGNPEDLRLLEKLFQEFGAAEDQLPEVGAEEDAVMSADVLPDQGANTSDTGSTTARSELGEGKEGLPPLDGIGNRHESWVTINGSNGSLPGPDRERRPSLPVPASRPRQSPPYTLPSLPHPPDGLPLFGTTSPGMRSIPAPSPSYASPPSNQPPSQYFGATSTRLQPINSWLTSRQQPPPPPPYSQSLPPINAPSPSSSLPMLPPPGAVNYGVASPPATDSGDSGTQPSVCLGGDDLLAFLDGSESDEWSALTISETGVPAGWLSTVWTEFAR